MSDSTSWSLGPNHNHRKSVLESLRRDAERWRAIEPYLTAGKMGTATCVSLSHIFHFGGDLTVEQVVDRLVAKAKKP